MAKLHLSRHHDYGFLGPKRRWFPSKIWWLPKFQWMPFKSTVRPGAYCWGWWFLWSEPVPAASGKGMEIEKPPLVKSTDPD